MMSFKLAMRNVKNSFRDYAVYFLTITFGVCIFYVFNSIESQRAMLVISESQKDALKTLNEIMGIASVFVSVIFGFLILYANRFLIKRRKKELGIYMTLGMAKGQISRILIIETVLVGVFSLGLGLLIGVFLSQGLAVVTASMFEVKLAAFVFVFSFPAMVKVIIYFGIAFLLVIAFNTLTIERQRLINLIYAGRRNEKFKAPRFVLSICLFIAAIACLGIAYGMILKDGLAMIDRKFLVTIALGCVGTFLFFFSLSGFFLKLISQSKKVYLKNLNMFVLRQVNSKINTAYVSMTMVCLMLFVAICTLSAGMGVAKAVTTELNEITPFDATYAIGASPYDFDESGKIIYENYYNADERLKDMGVDISPFAKEHAAIYIYGAGFTVMIGNQTVYPLLVKLSEYNAVLELQGKQPIALAAGEYAINSNMTVMGEYDWQQMLRDYATGKPEISVSGKNYRTNPRQLHHNAIIVSGSRYDPMTLILPDSAFDDFEYDSSHCYININYIEDSEVYEDMCISAAKPKDIVMEYIGFINFQSRREVFQSARSLSTTIAYLVIYIGIVFLITASAILAIAQLSEASDNANRYGLLRKIGAEDRMINRALFSQISIYFGVPLALAVIHSVVGIIVASDVVAAFGSYNIFEDSVFIAVAMVVVYGGYFAATYLGSKSIINRVG